MNRRNFLAGLAATPVAAQTLRRPTNLDEHGDKLAGEDHATMSIMKPHGLKDRVAPAPAQGLVPVWTRSYDNYRSGCNLQETVLTPANVAGLQKLYSYQVPDDERIEAQPLIVPGVTLADGRVRDLCIVATMGNNLYAFDAHRGDRLYWSVNLGEPIDGSTQIDGWMINQHWGILSTPVINQTTQILYCVTWSDPTGNGAATNWKNAVHTLRGINLRDGTPVLSLPLSGVTYNPGNGLPVQHFNASERKQRAGLALASIEGSNVVVMCFGTISETGANSRGWVIVYDCADQTLASFTTTSRYSGAGIWMAGQAPAIDDQGFIYVVTGNGSFDARTEWGECFLKLLYSPLTGTIKPTISVVDWYSPFSDSGRAGGPQTGDHITVDNGNGWDDMDLGSGGIVVIPQLGIVGGAGKDGIWYGLKQGDMGKTQLADFANPAANYAKAQIEWFTYYNPATPTPQIFSALNQIYQGRTRHMHSTPVHFQSANGTLLYCWGENSNLRAYSVDQTGRPKYLACSAETASPQSPVPPGGMPGGMLALSANGNQNAILWALVPMGDANKQITAGMLYAYDATNFGTYSDGSGAIRLLGQWPVSAAPKFNLPVISGGRAFVPTYSGTVDVWGLV